MNKQEQHTLIKIIKDTQHIQLPRVVYEEKDGQLHRKELMSQAEADRLFESADFREGWERCHACMKELLIFFMTASTSDLVRYAGKPKRG